MGLYENIHGCSAEEILPTKFTVDADCMLILKRRRAKKTSHPTVHCRSSDGHSTVSTSPQPFTIAPGSSTAARANTPPLLRQFMEENEAIAGEQSLIRLHFEYCMLSHDDPFVRESTWSHNRPRRNSPAVKNEPCQSGIVIFGEAFKMRSALHLFVPVLRARVATSMTRWDGARGR